MDNVVTYAEARSEYTKQLATFIVPAIVSWFQKLWSKNEKDRQNCMFLFQTECEEIPRWNQDRIHDEVCALIERSRCDYLEELMTAVFIAHTKVLTAVRLSETSRKKKLSITVPKLDHFIHRIFCESSRCYWKSVFLFMTNIDVIDHQKNVLQIELYANEAITAAVRSLLPVKQILNDYLGEDEADDESTASNKVPTPTLHVTETEQEPETVTQAVPVPVPVAPVQVPVPPVLPVLPVQAPAPVPVPVPVPETPSDVKEISNANGSVVKIDTERSVHFSDYNSVFDETLGEPKLTEVNDSDDHDNDDLDHEDKDSITIDENSAKPISVGDDDIEDLDAPPAPAPAPVPILKKSDTIGDDEVEMLD